jgi:hypothetical protein
MMMAHTLGGAQTALFPLTFMDRDRYIKCFLTFVRSATFPFSRHAKAMHPPHRPLRKVQNHQSITLHI